MKVRDMNTIQGRRYRAAKVVEDAAAALLDGAEPYLRLGHASAAGDGYLTAEKKCLEAQALACSARVLLVLAGITRTDERARYAAIEATEARATDGARLARAALTARHNGYATLSTPQEDLSLQR